MTNRFKDIVEEMCGVEKRELEIDVPRNEEWERKRQKETDEKGGNLLSRHTHRFTRDPTRLQWKCSLCDATRTQKEIDALKISTDSELQLSAKHHLQEAMERRDDARRRCQRAYENMMRQVRGG